MSTSMWTTPSWLLAVVLCVGMAPGTANAEDDLLAAYRRAEALLPENVEPELRKTQLRPRWLEGTDRFWYRVAERAGHHFVLVDAARNERTAAFDHGRLAQALTRLLGRAVSAQALPIDALEYRGGGRVLRFVLDAAVVECDLRQYRCDRAGIVPASLPGEVGSPDGHWAAFVREHDLYIRSLSNGTEVRLTEDGSADHGYGELADSHLLSVSTRLSGRVRPASVLWSPDSSKLLTYRVDQRGIPEMPYVQWVPPEGYGARPRIHTARVPLPADEKTATAQLMVFELGADPSRPRRIDLQVPPLPMAYDLIGWGYVWWDASSRQVFHVREERGYRQATLNVTDAGTGASRVLFTETASTYLINDYGQLAHGMSAATFHWLSESDGWQHIYRHDSRTGKRLAQVTRGEWRVDRLMRVDEAGAWVYFTAGGRERGLDPYYLQLYRVRWDRSGHVERLTPEDSHHEIQFAPSGRYFIDRHSRVDQPPVVVLRRADGRLVRVLEQAPAEPPAEIPRQQVERFKVKGRDGVTDIHGTLFKPSTFDPSRRYPVLDDIYGGPQLVKAQRAFGFGSPQAELGFIDVQIDGMGTPGRSKAFQDVSYGEGFAEAGGLMDHVAALRALARDRPYMDLTRVGIYGHSGGGYAATRALLDYPEFFRVAVASAGSHDQRLYQLEWGERFIGRPAWQPEAYALQANSGHVAGFKGRLLLVHGALDDDVPIVNTMQLADALIAANKDFDLLIVPGADHASLLKHPYFIRRRWDYLVSHLLGTVPPADYRVR